MSKLNEKIILTKEDLQKRLIELEHDKSFPIPVSREYLMELIRVAIDGLKETE